MAKYKALREDYDISLLHHDGRESSDAADGKDNGFVMDDASERILLSWKAKRTWRNAVVPEMNCSACILTMCLLALTAWTSILYERRGSNAPRFRPQYSPMYDNIDIPVVTKTLDPFIPWKTDHPDRVYSQPAGPEVDEAWRRIDHAMVFIPLTADQARRMGKDPSTLIQMPTGFGYDGRYLSTQDATHQIHCLNYLRRSLIHNYHHYWGKKWGFWPPFSLVRHLTHCVDILRQHIMCNADFELYTYNWREGQSIKWPDFGVRKTCRDYDTLLKWLEDNVQKDLIHLYRNITKPDDANELSVPLGFAEYVTEETYVNSEGTSMNPIPGLADKPYCLG